MRLVQIEEEKNNKKKSSLKAADCLLQRLVNGFNTVDYFDKYYRNNACDNKNLDGMSRSSLCQPLLPVFLISNFYGGNDPEKISGVEGGREGEEKRISTKDEKISQSIVNNLIERKNIDSLQPGFPFSSPSLSPSPSPSPSLPPSTSLIFSGSFPL